jgi:hypothetical protein
LHTPYGSRCRISLNVTAAEVSSSKDSFKLEGMNKEKSATHQKQKNIAYDEIEGGYN